MPVSNYILGNRFMLAGATGSAGANTHGAHRMRSDGNITDSNFEDIGIILRETGSVEKQGQDRTVIFKNEIYNLIGSKVYRYSAELEPGTWLLEAEFPQVSPTGNSNYIGLYPMMVGGVPYLVTAYQRGSSTTWEAVRKNGNTGVWESGTTGTVFNATIFSNGGIFTEARHKDRIFFIDANTTTVGFYDAAQNTFGTVAWAESDLRHPMNLAVYSGDLYCLNKNSSRHILIHRITAGFTERVIRLGRPHASGDLAPPTSDIPVDLAPTATNNYFGRNLLLTDNEFLTSVPPSVETGPHPPRMYAFNYEGSPGSENSALYEVEGDGLGGLTEKRRGDVRTPFGGDEDTVVRGFWNKENKFAVPGVGRSDALIEFRAKDLIFSPSQGPNDLLYQSYAWDGIEVFGGMTQIGGIQLEYHKSYRGKDAGGQYISPFVSLQGHIVDIFPDSLEGRQNGVMRLGFQLPPGTGTPAGSTVAVQFQFDKLGHAPKRNCTIVGASEGTIGADNVVRGIIANSGQGYFVDWAARSDGVAKFERVNVQGFVATTGATP